MPVDYDTPKYRLAQAAQIAGFDLVILRGHFQTGRFTFMDSDRPADVSGASSLLSVTSIINLAIAAQLCALKIRPRAAFLAAMKFSHFGSHPGRNPEAERRAPGRLFDPERFQTILVYRVDESFALPVPNDGQLDIDLLFDGGAVRLGAAAIVPINPIVERVFRELGIEAA